MLSNQNQSLNEMRINPDILLQVLTNANYDRKRTNIVADCPWCGAHEFGIAINKKNHPFQCYRKRVCGEVGTIFKLLKKIGAEHLLRNKEDTIDIHTGLVSLNNSDKTIQITVPDIELPIGYKRIYHHDYLTNERGFTEQDYLNYEVGQSRVDPTFKNNYLIFPVRESGLVKGFVGRSTYSKEYVKDWNSTHAKHEHILRWNNSSSDFSILLYGIDELSPSTRTAIIVEGIFKKRNIDKLLNLHSKEDIKCVATFGAKFSYEQATRLQNKGVTDIIIIFDPDAVKQTKQVSEEVAYKFDSVRIGYHATIAPDDYTEEDCTQVMSNLTDFVNFSYRRVKILEL